ncbi:MAG: sugar phosphate isomerase/epimerase [Phycisphaerales bacterium]|nr:sugar phosphate isomerase/epimerase [Phycisphaerales bacterium]
MMTLGTVGAFGFPDFPPPEVIGLYADAGCSVVQVYRNREKEISAAEITAVCSRLSVTIESLHAHFGDDLDPSSEDEALRTATLELYAREAEYCRQLGGRMMVIHPSPAHAPEGDLDRRYAQFKKSVEDFARLGERTGVVCAIENMPPYHPVGDDVKRLVDTIAGAQSEYVQFLLDFGHAHMTCGIVEAIRVSNGHLRHTHVHDNDGIHDKHKLPYQGTLPWEACGKELHAIGYDGVFMLEVFESADDLRRLLDDGWKRNIQAILNNGK